MKLVCKNCGKDSSLYQEVEVPGWRPIVLTVTDPKDPVATAKVEDDHEFIGYREVEWSMARPVGFGCGECQHEGIRLEHVFRVEYEADEIPFIEGQQELSA